MRKSNYDAVVVGAGPNGLAAAITMQQVGLSVLLIEGNEQAGGGVRSKELTLPGFIHDVCSTVYPLVRLSPFFEKIATPPPRAGIRRSCLCSRASI